MSKALIEQSAKSFVDIILAKCIDFSVKADKLFVFIENKNSSRIAHWYSWYGYCEDKDGGNQIAIDWLISNTDITEEESNRFIGLALVHFQTINCGLPQS